MINQQTVGAEPLQRALSAAIRRAEVDGDAEAAETLCQMKLDLARVQRRATCRTCAHWDGANLWCSFLDCGARPIQGCGYHAERREP